MPDQKNEMSLSEALEGQSGFVPPRYRSGQRSSDMLLESGRSLLTQMSLPRLSVRDLCKEASLTTGAFYRRFENKEAFFHALQRLALDDAEHVKQTLIALLSTAPPMPMTLYSFAYSALDTIRVWFARHQGVLRASAQQHEPDVDNWQPFRALGENLVQDLAPHMRTLPELRDRDDILPRLQTIFQITISTMVNAALNNPNPLKLGDSAMSKELALVFTLYMSTQV